MFEIFQMHGDVIKWKHFPRNWPFVREIHRSPVNFPHKGQWRGALMFSLIYAWINDWVNNREAGDLRRQNGHYDVTVMALRYYRSLVNNAAQTTYKLQRVTHIQTISAILQTSIDLQYNQPNSLLKGKSPSYINEKAFLSIAIGVKYGFYQFLMDIEVWYI